LLDYKKARNPLTKYWERLFSAIDHCEGYYKVVELERNHGSQIVRALFEGKFDEDFRGRSI
jgi:hypothetical protein